MCVQKCREPLTDGDSTSEMTVDDVMLSAKLKEVDLMSQLNESREKLLITEQQVTSLSLHVISVGRDSLLKSLEL